MAKGKKLIVGNWKMNFNVHEASMFVHKLYDQIKSFDDVEVVVAPTTLALQSLALQVDHENIKLATQNLYWRDHGAYTGEVSAAQLRGMVSYAIVGHSERRHVFMEGDKDIRNKVQAAIRNQIKPILCIGETAHERATGETHEVLHDQLAGGLSNITGEEINEVVIAYEPVWSIGTGKNANPHEVQTIAKVIRTQIKHLFGADAAKAIRILYGGSVTPESAADYMATPGIDGLLVGALSLDAQKFAQVIKKAQKKK